MIQSDIVAVDSTIILATRNDKDARWTKQRTKSYFGYKIHLMRCVESEFPLVVVVTSTNKHDSNYFTTLYSQLPAKLWYVLGDAAYDTSINKAKRVVKNFFGVSL